MTLKLEQDADAALRRVVSGQGIHPSEYTLLSCGGSHPLHLAGCARGIGFKDILTFQFAAGFSAFGCTTADFMRRHSVSTQIDIAAAADATALRAHARDKVTTAPFLMMRYTGQSEDVEVHSPVAAPKSADDMRRILAEFETVYGAINHRVSRYGAAGFSIMRVTCVSAREMARRISASPGVREVGEMVVALYTPEGDAVALSNGIMVHVHTMRRFIKRMIREPYEENPGIAPGGIFADNDAFIGTVQVPDVMDAVPIYHAGKQVGWAGAVCHELESGGIRLGGDVCLAQERFTEGLFVCAEKIGSNDKTRRDHVIRCERNLRMPIWTQPRNCAATCGRGGWPARCRLRTG